MKLRHFLSCCLLTLLFVATSNAQPKPKQQQPSKTDINKMMEDAMKAEGMSKEEQEQMKKMMGFVMPALMEQNAKTADYPEFTNNRQLIPKKDAAKLSTVSKKTLGKADVSGYTTNLYNKILAKGDPAEIALAKKIIAQTPKPENINNAAILAMLQGHPETAMALTMKAVQSDPSSLNYQNNMAALLTQYGYPEQAMPLLRKLNNDLPLNSTILNNIGQAWIGLGEPDSAIRFFASATRVNPLHPDAKLCGGLMEELQGDPIKAEESYMEALENSHNPFTEQALKNHNNKYNPADLDFEKIKRQIAIYEYFPKNWMPELPKLSNDVKKYNEDFAIKKGYAAMIEEFKKQVESMTDVLDNDLENMAKKKEDEFVQEMVTENMQGLSFMSKPATIVLRVLSSYQLKFQMDHVEELKKIYSWKTGLYNEKKRQIDAINKIIYSPVTSKNAPRCEDYKSQLDQLENDYMQKVNTRLREYLITETEQFREWLNAWCTWNWYVTGNIKNVILLQDLGATGYIAELYGGIVSAMETLPEHCSSSVSELTKKFIAPKVPAFTCPAVVSIPAGMEWEQLVASAKNFDANNLGIKKTNKPVPNVSVAYGTSAMVAQPGLSPFIKTANGSLVPGNINKNNIIPPISAADIEKGRKMRLPPDQEPDELTPLQSNLLNIEKIKNKMVKDLLDKMMSTACTPTAKKPKRKVRFVIGIGELTFEEAPAKTYNVYKSELSFEGEPTIYKTWYNENGDVVATSETEKGITGSELNLEGDPTTYYYNKNGDLVATSTSATVPPLKNEEKPAFKITPKSSGPDAVNNGTITEMKNTANQIQSAGLQPTVSSGLQTPGTFTPNKTLFQ